MTAQATGATPSRQAVAPPRSRLPIGKLAAYGAPVLGYAFLLFFVQFYFLKFATDVLLLAPGVIGLIFGAGRIWDAVFDPLVGYWSDGTRTRLGRRRPWLFAALAPIALTFVMIWSPPEGLGTAALTLWSAIALIGFYTALTMYIIPHQSLGAEMTSDYHERSRLFGVQAAAFVGGMILSFAGIEAVSNASHPRAAATSTALLAAGFAIAILLVPPALLRERADYQGRGSDSPRGALRDVMANPHARILLFFWFIQSLGVGALGTLSPYLAEYILRRPDQIARLPAFFVITSVLSIPLWVRLSRVTGKRDVWRAAMVLAAISFGLIFFVGEGDLTLLRALLVCAGAAFGCGQVVGPAMLADVIDYDEYRTRERKEGAYTAAWGFALKFAIGFQIMVAGIVLQLAGFVPNVDQTSTTKLALRLLAAGMPFVFFLLGAIILGRFRLNEREHAEIRARIEARRSEG